MNKNLISIIISVGLIISASIILNIGRYEVKNVKINTFYGKDGTMSTLEQLIKIDRVTGKVWVNLKGFSFKDESYDNWELVGVGKRLKDIYRQK